MHAGVQLHASAALPPEKQLGEPQSRRGRRGEERCPTGPARRSAPLEHRLFWDSLRYSSLYTANSGVTSLFTDPSQFIIHPSTLYSPSSDYVVKLPLPRGNMDGHTIKFPEAFHK